MKGFYTITEKEDEKNVLDISENTDNSEEVPKEQKELKESAEELNKLIVSADNISEREKAKYFRYLKKICENGLIGDNPETLAAQDMLNMFKEYLLLSEKISIKGCFIVSENENEKYDIRFNVASHVIGVIPEDQQKLQRSAEATCNVIKSLDNTEDEIKSKYFKKLLSLSQVGLAGKEPQTSAAQTELDILKEEIRLVEGKRIKNNYMINLGKKALLMALILGLVLVINSYLLMPYNNGLEIINYICVAFAGVLAGTWISFGARKFNIEFEDLSLLEKDMMSPFVRLFYICIATLILMVFCSVGVFEIKVGNVNSISVFSDYSAAMTIGLIAGLIESQIGVKVYEKASTFFKTKSE